MHVRDVMTAEVATVRSDTPFSELVDLMLEHDVSGLPVVDDGRLVGIVTEADLLSKEAYGGRRRRLLEVLADLVAGGELNWAVKSKGRTAGQVMTADPVFVRSSDDIRTAARRMLLKEVKRLPVVDDDDRLVGIVSRPDLLAAMHRSDGEIRDALESAFADPLRAPEGLETDLEVSDGVVTITGTTPHPRDVEVLTHIAWRVAGVVGVDNQASGREPDPRAV